MPDLHSTNKVNECRSLVDRGARQGQSLDGDATLCPSPSVNRLAGALIGSRPPINTLSEFVLSSSNPLQLTLHDPNAASLPRRVDSQILTGAWGIYHRLVPMNPRTPRLSLIGTQPGLCTFKYTRAFYQFGMEFTNTLDLDLPSYNPPSHFPIAYRGLSMPPLHRTAVVNALVHVHSSLHQINQRLSRRQVSAIMFAFTTEKRDELEEQQRHLHVGLDKLRDTVTQVEELRKSLAIKRSQL
ncbi:hypothetical protein B0H11DRAFT_2264865 [Mycena galericulata]|nr:hypothetical protein B0H11DRAFT_2264865 [Mycena galericulata]